MSATNDRIKGKADVFSFVLDVLEGMRKNQQERSCGEIVDMIERYVNTPLRAPTSNAYHAGVAEGVQYFREYFGKVHADMDLGLTSSTAGTFTPREDKITDDALRYVYNAVEEHWEELFRQLPATGPKMTLGERWAADER